MSKIKTQLKESKTGTKKQADAVTEGQLMAMFGETIESATEIIKESKKEKKSKRMIQKKSCD